MDATVQDIVETIVNDGNGDMCGYTYQERLTMGRRELRRACANYASRRVRMFECERASAAQLDAAVEELWLYYLQHKREIADTGE
jgi:hypothetical protein